MKKQLKEKLDLKHSLNHIARVLKNANCTIIRENYPKGKRYFLLKISGKEIGIFEKVDKQFIIKLEKENRFILQENCSGYTVPKQSEIGTFVFGTLGKDLPKELHSLFTYVYDW